MKNIFLFLISGILFSNSFCCAEEKVSSSPIEVIKVELYKDGGSINLFFSQDCKEKSIFYYVYFVPDKNNQLPYPVNIEKSCLLWVDKHPNKIKDKNLLKNQLTLKEWQKFSKLLCDWLKRNPESSLLKAANSFLQKGSVIKQEPPL
jgi:hypothetical protein